EADQVAEQAVAEDRGGGAALALDPPRRVQQLRLVEPALAVPAQVDVDRPAQDGLVGDEPVDPRLHGQVGDALPHRQLRWPEAAPVSRWNSPRPASSWYRASSGWAKPGAGRLMSGSASRAERRSTSRGRIGW